MGFIEFLKNKLFSSNDATPVPDNQNSTQPIQTQNTVRYNNNVEFDNSEDEMLHIIQKYLIGTPSYASNPKWHRTNEEKELNFQFFKKNFDYLKEEESKLIDLNMKANATITDIDVTISDCKKAIQAFYNLKDFCYKTKGGILYFQDMWEYCHNSQNPCFCVIEKTEKRLQDLTDNYDERKNFYKRREYVKNNLKNDLLTLISNHENILQKEVYSHFDADLKDNIARMLLDMDKKGEIKRVKHGSTYQLSIK